MAALNVRSVLVTGSNRGIGLELIKQLVGKSNRPEWIFATCRDPEGPHAQALKNLAAEHQGVIIIQLDVSDLSSVKAAAARVAKHLKGAGLNLLINNAGIAKLSTLETATLENMSEVYQTNVTGTMMVSQAFLPLLRKASQESPQKGMSCSKAAIVNISSEAGSITTLLMWQGGKAIAYRCSKAALNMLTKCQSLGFSKDGILSIALHPGVVQTEMTGPGAALNMLTKCQSLGFSKDGILSIALHPGVVQTEMTGPGAPLPVDVSVQGILNTLSHLSEKDSGTFVNWEGKVVPW